MSKSETTEPESETAEGLRDLLAEAEKALNSLAGEADDGFDDLRSRLRTALRDNENLFHRLRDQATQHVKQADKMVRENPYYAIGIAAGIGAIVGLCLSRSCQNSRHT